MAERRMFHMSVVESDAFLDLPIGAQALYFHIGMHADDDGFVNGPKQIMRKMGGEPEMLQALYDRGFLLDFDGIAVVKHWRMANSMRIDRMKPLQYPELARKIYVRENRSYTAKNERGAVNLVTYRKRHMDARGVPDDCQMDAGWLTNGCQMDAEEATDGMPKVKESKRKKNKTKERNIKESNPEESNPTPPGADAACEGWVHDSQKEKKSVINLTPREISDLMEKMGSQAFSRYVLKLSDFIRQNNAKVKDHYATILKWWREDGFDNENLEVSL